MFNMRMIQHYLVPTHLATLLLSGLAIEIPVTYKLFT